MASHIQIAEVLGDVIFTIEYQVTFEVRRYRVVSLLEWSVKLLSEAEVLCNVTFNVEW